MAVWMRTCPVLCRRALALPSFSNSGLLKSSAPVSLAHYTARLFHGSALCRRNENYSHEDGVVDYEEEQHAHAEPILTDVEKMYPGISSEEPYVSEEARAILSERFADDELLFSSFHGIEQLSPTSSAMSIRLDRVYGKYQWQFVPKGSLIKIGGAWSREFALFGRGRFLAQAGSTTTTRNPRNVLSNLHSLCFKKCCKAIGLGVYLDRNEVLEWKNRQSPEKLNRLMEKVQVYKSTRITNNNNDDFSDASESNYVGLDDRLTPELDEVVPYVFKKYAGKTWREVVSTKDGLSYLKWASKTFDEPYNHIARTILTINLDNN